MKGGRGVAGFMISSCHSSNLLTTGRRTPKYAQQLRGGSYVSKGSRHRRCLSILPVAPILLSLAIMARVQSATDVPTRPNDSGAIAAPSEHSNSETSEHASGGPEARVHGDSERGERGEGTEAEVHGHGGDGEEDGTQFARDETYDGARAGARLILSYDAAADAFIVIGTVENTNGSTLRAARVEVHLSNGIELGPTSPIDLAPGRVPDVSWDVNGESSCRGTHNRKLDDDGEHRTSRLPCDAEIVYPEIARDTTLAQRSGSSRSTPYCICGYTELFDCDFRSNGGFISRIFSRVEQFPTRERVTVEGFCVTITVLPSQAENVICPVS